MSQKYCNRCRKNITYSYTYSVYCRNCKDRIYGEVPDYVPDEQVSDYRRLKNV